MLTFYNFLFKWNFSDFQIQKLYLLDHCALPPYVPGGSPSPAQPRPGTPGQRDPFLFHMSQITSLCYKSAHARLDRSYVQEYRTTSISAHAYY